MPLSQKPAPPQTTLLEEQKSCITVQAKIEKKIKVTEKHAKDLQIIVAAKQAGKPVPKGELTKREYGCLRGLVEDWKDFAPALLRRTITPEGWVEFCVAVDLYVLEIGGHKLFLEFPSLSVIRRFWFLAVANALHDAQDAKAVSPQVANQLLSLIEVMKQKTEAMLAEKAAGKASASE